ncbi:MAG TPA: oxidoreductase, partial [Bacteroidia bacterium]|nr:oxidoreductase [Bacteroidia bacterium]
NKTVILRPSMLLGDRKEFRFTEALGKFFMVLFSIFIPKKYRAVEAEDVAKAMIKCANDEVKGDRVVENKRI